MNQLKCLLCIDKYQESLHWGWRLFFLYIWIFKLLHTKFDSTILKITSSFKFDTNRTFERPRKAADVVDPNAPDDKAKAPKLGIPLLYALAMADGWFPRPIAVNGGRTPGLPMPFMPLT